MGTYVTSDGFQKKILAEIKLKLEADFQDIFGDDIDLDPESNFGQIIGKMAKDFADLWDALQEIYNSRDPSQAIGISLDNIASENALQRLPATGTAVPDVLLYGDDATAIAAGKKVKRSNESVSGLEYSLDSVITIQKSTARYGKISVNTVLNNTLYTVTINSIAYTYTSDADATALEILNGLKTDIDAGSWVGTTTVDATNEWLELRDNDLDFDFTVDSNLDIEEVASAGDFTATLTGAYTLPANSLDTIVTSVTGWNSVDNPSAGITGRAIETDAEFRLRREQSVSGIGNATEEAIRSNLLNDVDGVTAVAIYSNRTDTTDSEGRPEHSFECVVEGGTDADIAQKIWDTQPAGIKSYGNTTVYVTDTQGYVHAIKFSRSVNEYIFVKVKRDLYNEETYPADGDDAIKDAIVAWSLNTSNINIGKDVIRQRLSTPVYEVPGIEDIEITLDSNPTLPHTPSYSATNIIIADREKAIFSKDRIVVEVLTP